MFPLVPYLSGEPHPLGKRIMNVQRCLRFFEDLDNVGETNRHTTAFHMIGNWSLGDYFKKEQLNWFYQFLTEELGLDPHKMYASVFTGDEDAPKDEASIDVIKEIFSRYGIEAKEGERIFAYGKEDNWWQRGEAVGELGGPDSEVFYYIGAQGDGFGKDPAQHQDEFLEIGNSVFMQYKKTELGWEELPQKNVDFGGGLERLATVVQGKRDIYETDNFYPVIKKLEEISGKTYLAQKTHTKAMRVIADHMRAATFLAMDGVLPSNKDQGYILRRLIRRTVRAGKMLDIEKDISVVLVPVVVEMFSWLYPELTKKENEIKEVFAKEEARFRKTLQKGAREFEKEIENIRKFVSEQKIENLVELAFDMYQSFGYPLEMFFEDLNDHELPVSGVAHTRIEEGFEELFEKHQEKSRAGAEQKFKGGLADHSDQVIKYHTATHLLHYALRQVLGEDIVQHGSNITGERLRFDFNFPRKMTKEEMEEVEKIINREIKAAHPVNFEIMSKEKALQTGAIHAFNEKYGEKVKIYYIGESLEKAMSKEFCGGPHVENTLEIGKLELYKQDKIGRGMLRVYAR
jgi:alanyl-tRNA synthetase